MSNSPDGFSGRSFADDFSIAAEATVDARAAFLAKTYTHLFGAVLAFAAIVAGLSYTPLADGLVKWLVEMPLGGLIFLGGFMVVSWIAHSWAASAVSPTTQYMGLSLYVVAEAVFFTPLIWFANHIDKTGYLVPTAAAATLGLFGILTMIVFTTRHNFSWLGPALTIAGIAAFGLVIASMVLGFQLGIAFTVALIAFACAYILYDTSAVLHDYRIGQHVAASLALFSSLMLLFWYILRFAIYMYMSSDE